MLTGRMAVQFKGRLASIANNQSRVTWSPAFAPLIQLRLIRADIELLKMFILTGS